MTYLIHFTLDTAEAHRVRREDFHDGLIDALKPAVERAIHGIGVQERAREMVPERIGVALDAAMMALHWPPRINLRPLNVYPSEERKFPPPPSVSLTMGAEHMGMTGTLWRGIDGREAPVVTFGCAAHSMASRKVWRLLHAPGPGRGPTATDPDDPPAVPWLASRMEIGAALLAQRPEGKAILMALADLQQCIAWAWLERPEKRPASRRG